VDLGKKTLFSVKVLVWVELDILKLLTETSYLIVGLKSKLWCVFQVPIKKIIIFDSSPMSKKYIEKFKGTRYGQLLDPPAKYLKAPQYKARTAG